MKPYLNTIYYFIATCAITLVALFFIRQHYNAVNKQLIQQYHYSVCQGRYMTDDNIVNINITLAQLKGRYQALNMLMNYYDHKKITKDSLDEALVLSNQLLVIQLKMQNLQISKEHFVMIALNKCYQNFP